MLLYTVRLVSSRYIIQSDCVSCVSSASTCSQQSPWPSLELPLSFFGLVPLIVILYRPCPQVCMVRMQADARLPEAQKLGYRHIGDALVRVGKEEGITTYWRGATPTGEWTSAHSAVRRHAVAPDVIHLDFCVYADSKCSIVAHKQRERTTFRGFVMEMYCRHPSTAGGGCVARTIQGEAERHRLSSESHDG